ncbi:MAG: mechanosensitive ion channel family protein [Polyangiaceae bacterium]|nr:mechanosensitive ion channel family protein [Polyangiaceae bacterium]
MESVVSALSGASGQTIGVSIAVALLLVALALFDAKERAALRPPAYLLVAHLALHALGRVFDDGSTLRRVASLLALAALLASIGRAGVLVVVDALLGRRLGRPLPKIIRDILQGVVYFVLLLGFLRQLGLQPESLLTTSALLTAVLGLSLQDTLGNLIAGLAVQAQEPFSVGDWIQYDTDTTHIGRVLEINWRATRILTLDQVEIVVPNGLLAKVPLTNFTRPTRISRRNLYFHAGLDVPPRRVHDVILEALRDLPGVLTEPPPTVITSGFSESGVQYWVRVFIDDFQQRDPIDGQVRERIWYALRRAGIGIGLPQRSLSVQQHSDESRAREDERRIERRKRALEGVGFLAVIDDGERRALAERATLRLYSPGEAIVRQGEESDELFIILAGEATVTVTTSTGDVELARLGAGKFFGEMALVTGEARAATVSARTECELLVIDHDAFDAVLQARPELVERLSLVLAERQLELDEHLTRRTEDERTSLVQQESTQLLSRIRRFFAME